MPRMPRELHINLHEITKGACRKLAGHCPHTVCRFNLTSERRDNRGAKPAEMQLPVVREAYALEATGMTPDLLASPPLKECPVLVRRALRLARTRELELPVGLGPSWIGIFPGGVVGLDVGVSMGRVCKPDTLGSAPTTTRIPAIAPTFPPRCQEVWRHRPRACPKIRPSTGGPRKFSAFLPKNRLPSVSSAVLEAQKGRFSIFLCRLEQVLQNPPQSKETSWPKVLSQNPP
jgi:hypothetical protein